MSVQHQKYVDYIQQSINNICPYEQGHERTLYHAGFMAAVLADLMLNDSNNYQKFKQRVDQLDSKYNNTTDKQANIKR